MEHVIANMIEELQNTADGQLIDRGRVLDHLLDLRLAAGGQSAFVSLVDELLANIPGKTVVEGAWWNETLSRLGETAQPEAVS
mgnify:CR=1 FL=1|jgi:hypothetical protein